VLGGGIHARIVAGGGSVDVSGHVSRGTPEAERGGAPGRPREYPEGMTRRFAYVLGAVLVALVQARLLPELGLQRALNLPAVVLIVTSSVERRTLALAAATVAGLTIDVALLRPLGLTSLALVVGVAVASQIRGAGDAPIVRRAAAILFGFVASNVTMVVLNGGSTGYFGENAPSFGLNIAIAIALAWFGQRRRTSYQLDRSLRG